MKIAEVNEVGSLGVFHLKRHWSLAMAARQGKPVAHLVQADIDKAMLNALGVGLHQSTEYLFNNAPSFCQYEDWIVALAGIPDANEVDRLNANLISVEHTEVNQQHLQAIDIADDVLDEQQLDFWHTNGYVKLSNIVSNQQLLAAKQAVLDYIRVSLDNPTSWYNAQYTQGIMVELIQHQALSSIRQSSRLRKAFSQLWETSDLWASADRCGFHPPQTEYFPFPGPDLHWDVDFSQPLKFGTQGILYLVDTPKEQGALTLVPGFHLQLNKWLTKLTINDDPQQQKLDELGAIPIGGKAGDLIIWNQFLPHGSRPNLGNFPRIVQYINFAPCPSVAK